ncbi:MAG: TetR/AcrR family transcriptional regulator [Dehalococcoidales bacterium]
MKTNKTKPNLRKIQTEERRTQILDTALSVFAHKGFAGTTVKDIACSAGISDGLMYHYFPSKEKLLEAVVEKHSFLPQLRAILTNPEEPCRKVLKNIAIEFSSMFTRENDAAKIFLQEAHSNAEVKRVWGNLSNECSLILQQFLLSRIETGELKPHNTEVSARCILAIILMFNFTKDAFQSSNLSDKRFIEESVDSFLDGIEGNDACPDIVTV